jgi:hypothetical protein
MALQASVGFQIPTNVVEVGNEISADQLAAITNASTPSAGNPLTTQSYISGLSYATTSFVTSQGYVTSAGISQDQAYAIALTSNIASFVWGSGVWSGSIDSETPYFSANKASTFKFFMNNQYDFTPTWSGTNFSLSGTSDDTTYTTTGTGESFTVKWNSANGGVPVI